VSHVADELASRGGGSELLSLPEPPGPRPRAPWTNLLAIRRQRLRFFESLAREHGDVAGFRVGPQRIVLVSHPELIREVLVTNHRIMGRGRGIRRAKRLLGEGLLTSEGELHLRQRRLSQPAFHRQRIAGYADAMVAHSLRAAGRWRDGEPIDAHAEMMRLTLAIAGTTLFAADVDGEAREIGEALRIAFEAFEFALLPFTELLDRLPIPPVQRFNRARATLDAIVYRMIADRRRDGADRGDLLSMLMLARDEEGDGGRMSDEQLRDEAITILLAGHETTANALTFAWRLIARHPDVESRLHAEADAVLGGRAATADDVPRLPFARAVFAETLRLYPPAWILGYRNLEPLALGGHRLARDSLIFMSQWIVHRDPRWWPEPERFLPARWLPGAESPDRPRFAYFPFGGGPRQCIGESFAWMEGVLALATIAGGWRLRDATTDPIEVTAGFTLRPAGTVDMIVERR
jgi:cytochrome P450